MTMAVLFDSPHTHISRGNVAVKRKDGFKLNGNVVQTTRIGNTTIHFCDDYVARTPEEVEKVLDEMHAAGWSIWNSFLEKAGSKGGDAMEIKETTYISYCQVCGKGFKHLDIVYFAPIDNNIVCPECSKIHKDRSPRIYVDPNRLSKNRR